MKKAHHQRLLYYLLTLLFFTAFIACQSGTPENGNIDDGNDPVPTDPAPGTPDDDPVTIDPSGWESYSNTEFGISLKKPAGWQVVESKNVPDGGIAINVFPANSSVAADLPLDLHAEANVSYISIYPKGLGTEYPSGEFINYGKAPANKPDPGFSVDDTESKAFLLKSGKPWAYFMLMESPPSNWSDLGFIFAQFGVDHFHAACYDKSTGEAKPLDRCDTMEGDRYVRKGDIREREAAIIREMVNSIRLGDGSVQKRINELIRVDKPQPNKDVTSPLTVRGKAVGYWFFEGSFPVRLYDANNNLLAEGVAKADGEWMTKEFVPFTATLKFDAPDDERGRIVFARANPSDLPKNDREYAFPVIFPGK